MKILSLLGILLTLSSCSYSVYIDYSRYPKSNTELTETIPLPKGFHQDSRITDKTDFILYFARSREKLEGYKVLEQRPLAPALPYWDQRRSLGKKEIGVFLEKPPQKLTKETFLIPLEEINLPWKAVAVEGAYPGDKDYSYYIYTSYKLTSLNEKSLRDQKATRLNQWVTDYVKEFSRTQKLDTKDITLFRLGGVGDIMPGRGVDTILLDKKEGIKTVFTDLLPYLQKQDFLMGNLETVVTYSMEKTPKTFNFKIAPAVLTPLKEAGFDYFSLTNNHSYDYGEKGFLDTLTYLKEYGIPTSGAGLNLEGAQMPYDFLPLKEEKKIRILSLGAYPQEKNGFNGLTQAAAKEKKPGILWNTENNRTQLKETLSDEDYFSILLIHGGNEWENIPASATRKSYREFIDMGADLILAHHPHVLQGLEVYHGKLIAYSLGNFVFPGMKMMKHGEESLLLSLGMYKSEIRYVDYYPVQINHRILSLGGNSIARRFETLSRATHETK